MRKRCNQIPLRVDNKELQIINQKAALCGLTREEYLRRTAVGTVPKELPKADFTEILYQLRMIGNNIHQITVKANTLHFIDTPMYRKNYEHLQSVIGAIMEVIY